MLQRVKEVQESDLRMLGSLARNIQRVIAVTQADIDAAAAQGKAWVVKPVVKVSDPLDNLRGGTQLVIKQNSILPGQNVMRVMYIGGQAVVVGPGTSPLSLPDATDNDILSLIAFGGTTQGVPVGYTRVEYLQSDGNQCFKTDIKGLNTKVVIDAQYTGSSTSTLRELTTYDSNYAGTYFGVYSNKWGIVSSETIGNATTRSLVECVFTANANGYNKAELTVGNETTSYTRTSARPDKILYILGNGSYKFIGKMYSCQIYDNNTNELLFDGIPAVRKSDSLAGLYDAVSGQFLENIGTGTFSVGSDIVPTPDNPIDIVSNNGVIAFRDTELPAAYRRILGMTMNDDCYYEITGFKMNGSDTLRFSFTRTGANACNVLGAYDGTSADSNYSLYAGGASNAKYLRYNGGTYNSYAIADKKYDVVLTPTGSDGMETDSTWTAKTFTSTTNLCIGTTSPSATSSKMVGSIHGTVVVDGRLELIPCERISDGELGYYNTDTGTFYEPIGTTPISLGYDYSHYAVVADGPIETIAIKDDQNATVSTATAEMLLSLPNGADEQEIISGAVTRKVGVLVLDGTENWAAYGTLGNNSFRFNLSGFSFAKSDGLSTHVKVFYDTNASQTTNRPCITTTAGLLRWFDADKNRTLSSFKTWLQTQYNAGTPVIVLVPLATATTETVTGQPMSTAEGDNTVEITQAGMAGLELEVEYIKQ